MTQLQLSHQSKMTIPMLPMLPIPTAIRAANAIMGLLLMQGLTMSMWRGLVNTVSNVS